MTVVNRVQSRAFTPGDSGDSIGVNPSANLTFEDPNFWTSHEAEWTKAWNRIAKGA